MTELPQQVLNRIKADVEKICPLPKRTKMMPDDEWDDIVTIVGNQRLGCEIGLTAEATRSMKLVNEIHSAMDEMMLGNTEIAYKKLSNSLAAYSK